MQTEQRMNQLRGRNAEIEVTGSTVSFSLTSVPYKEGSQLLCASGLRNDCGSTARHSSTCLSPQLSWSRGDLREPWLGGKCVMGLL